MAANTLAYEHLHRQSRHVCAYARLKVMQSACACLCVWLTFFALAFRVL